MDKTKRSSRYTAALVAIVLTALGGCSDSPERAATAPTAPHASPSSTAAAAEPAPTVAAPAPVASTTSTAPVVRLRRQQPQRAALVSTDQADGAGREVEVSMRSADQVPTGSAVDTAVSVRNAPYPVTGVVLDYGDGTTGLRPIPGGALQINACDNRGPEGAYSADHTFTHGYRRAGTYEVRVVKVVLECGEEISFGGDPMRLTIIPGPARSNGPELPTATNCVLNPESFCIDQRDGAHVFGGLSDPDGYVESVRVDWGDGTDLTEVHFPLGECEDPGDRWPRGFRNLDVGGHAYSTAGSYTVRLTIVSTGCDGKDAQERTLTGTVNA
jgi:hypothetical protein